MANLEKSKIEKKDVGHVYVFATVNNFWDNSELVFRMGQDRGLRNFVFYPVRMCMETLLRFVYFCEQSQDQKNNIAGMEIIRTTARLYRREKLDGGINEPYAIEYKKIVTDLELKVPDIDKVQDKDLNLFPPINVLCERSGRKDPKRLYFLYQFLCEATHGKIISIKTRKQGLEFQEYRRWFMLLIPYCQEMLVLVDKHFIESKMRFLVEPSIKKVDEIIRGPLTIYEKMYSQCSGFIDFLVSKKRGSNI